VALPIISCPCPTVTVQNDESQSFWAMTTDPDQNVRLWAQADQRHRIHHISTCMIMSDIGQNFCVEVSHFMLRQLSMISMSGFGDGLIRPTSVHPT
jgi:hypothetical protein